MKPADHPEYELETLRLARTFDAIETWLTQLPVDRGTITDYAAAILLNWSARRRATLEQARSRPYFGRIDVDAGLDREQLYIGQRGLRDPDGTEQLVIDWRSPVAASFYRPGEDVRLRRRYRITDRSLADISDDAVGARGEIALSDSMLAQVLEEARGGGLRAVVETIQAEQDELVRAAEPLLVIQGAAGTGKTIVGLHRLAYVLYERRQARRGAERWAIVFGPNRLFLDYAGSVLPSLGETGVVQTTFGRWVGSWVKLSDGIRKPTGAAAPPPVVGRRRLVGSLRFGRAIERYVATVRKDVEWGLAHATIEFDFAPGSLARPYKAAVPASEIRTAIEAARTRPLEPARAAIRDRLWLRLRAEIDRGYAIARGDHRDPAPPRLVAPVRRQFEKTFDATWPPSPPEALYRVFAGSRSVLGFAAAGELSAGEIALVANGQPGPEDLPAIAWTGLVVQGPAPEVAGTTLRPDPTGRSIRYAHAIVDEAQEWVPLQFAVVARHADGMTILGDLAQALGAEAGLEGWHQVAEAAPGLVVRRAELRQSYRSTRQITEFANAIRASVMGDDGAPLPFPREGEPVSAWQAGSEQEMLDDVARQLRWLAGSEYETIAILCRSADRATEVGEALRARLERPVTLVVDPENDHAGDVSVLPVELSKGMDFAAVFVLEADAESYPGNAESGRLLYVAASRALHRLAVVWVGSPSRHLARALVIASERGPERATSLVDTRG